MAFLRWPGMLRWQRADAAPRVPRWGVGSWVDDPGPRWPLSACAKQM